LGRDRGSGALQLLQMQGCELILIHQFLRPDDHQSANRPLPIVNGDGNRPPIQFAQLRRFARAIAALANLLQHRFQHFRRHSVTLGGGQFVILHQLDDVENFAFLQASEIG